MINFSRATRRLPPFRKQAALDPNLGVYALWGQNSLFTVEHTDGSFSHFPAAPVMAFWMIVTLLWLTEGTTLIVVSDD